MVPILVGVGVMSTIAYFRSKKKKATPKILPPNVQYTFQKLLDAKLPAASYAKAADLFDEAGLKAEAELLRKRAALAGLPPEEKSKITAAYGKAMASNKPDGIRAVAEVLASKGAVGAATNLHNHAADVEKANQITPVQKVVTPASSPEAADATKAAIVEMVDAANAAGLPGTLAVNAAEQQAADAATAGPVSPGANPSHDLPVMQTIVVHDAVIEEPKPAVPSPPIDSEIVHS